MINLPQPIKDLGKATFSKVANKFVDFVITKYTGKSIKVFEAEGDIEADKVRTRWELLEKPFWLQAEAAKMGRQYTNLGNTLLKAVPDITAQESKVSEDNDVFWGFLEHSKEIANEDIQKVIAKIIAGEYNAPGSYSMSTLQIIKMLGKHELELFERVGSLLLNGEFIPGIVFILPHDTKPFYKELGLTFENFQELQMLGLFLPNKMTMELNPTSKMIYPLFYYGKDISFTPAKEECAKIKLPEFYNLTSSGRQILQHLKPQYNESYYNWLKTNYRIPKYKILGQ